MRVREALLDWFGTYAAHPSIALEDSSRLDALSDSAVSARALDRALFAGPKGIAA